MKKVILALCCALAILSSSSCSLDSDEQNFQFTVLEVVSADFPESFNHNGIHEIEVTFTRPNDCTFFEGFEVTSPETTTRIVSTIGTILESDSCNDSLEEVSATFRFRVDYTDTYLFRFYSGTDEAGNATYLEYEVPVMQ